MKGLFLETKDHLGTSNQEVYQNIALEDEIETEYFTQRNKSNSKHFKNGSQIKDLNYFSYFSESIYNLTTSWEINLYSCNLFLQNLLSKSVFQISCFAFFFLIILIPNIADLASIALVNNYSPKSNLLENIHSIQWKSYAMDGQGQYLIRVSNTTQNNFHVYIPYSLIEHINNSCIERNNAHAFIHSNGDKLIELSSENLNRGCQVKLKEAGSIFLRSHEISGDLNNQLIVEKIG